MVTVNQEITKIPTNIWFVHVDGYLNSRWGSRKQARAKKSKLALTNPGKSILLSSSSVTIGAAILDTHS